MEKKSRYLKIIVVFMSLTLLVGFTVLIITISNRIKNVDVDQNITNIDTIRLMKPEGMTFKSLDLIDSKIVVRFSGDNEEKIICLDLKKNIVSCKISIQK